MATKIEWIDGNREPQEKPNPDYPDGIDVDASEGHQPTCFTNLPYPAKRCGHYLIVCDICHQRVALTTAGRPDDPRSIRIRCALDKMSDLSGELLGPSGKFPQGKIEAEDEGELKIAVGTHADGKNVLIAFGKKVSWLGFPKDEAILFAELILQHARALKDDA